MRVLFLATYFPKPTNPTMGVWALKEAQQLLRRGVDVHVVSLTSWVPKILGRIGRASSWANCPPRHDWNGLLVEYPRWPFYQVGALKRLWHQRPGIPLAVGWRSARRALEPTLRDWQPDVIFAHHGTVNGQVAAWLYDNWKIPFVVKDYDFYEVEDCRRYSGRRSVYEYVGARAACMLTASERMRDSLQQILPQAHVVVHHNGADPIGESIIRNPRPTELTDKLVISSGGIWYDRKGIPLLVRAFASLANRYTNAVLRIFGDGQDRSEVEAIIRQHGLQDRVTLLGFLPHEKVQQELVWSDFFALVGWDEPFATVYLEAMSAGKPIVCANDGGINDVFCDGVHGLTVPPRDESAAARAMERLIVDAELRQSCSANASRLFATQLSAEIAAKKLELVLRDAAGLKASDG